MPGAEPGIVATTSVALVITPAYNLKLQRQYGKVTELKQELNEKPNDPE